MIKRFGLGFAAGYVLGARAGEQRFEQISSQVRRLADAIGAGDALDNLPDSASGAVQRLTALVRERGAGLMGGGSDGDPGEDDPGDGDSDEGEDDDEGSSRASQDRRQSSGSARRPARSGASKSSSSPGSSRAAKSAKSSKPSLGGAVSAAYQRGKVA